MKDLLILLPFILVPGIVLAFVRPAGRRILGVIGLAFGLLTELLVGSGADNYAGIFPFLGFGAAIAALFGEALAFLVRRIRGQGRSAAGGRS